MNSIPLSSMESMATVSGSLLSWVESENEEISDLFY